MQNSEYFGLLDSRLKRMQALRDNAKNMVTGIVGDTLFTDDLFFTSALNRSVELLDGQVMMLKERNLSCAGVLLRILVDNCMRIFAAFIAKDRVSFVDEFIAGKKISDFVDVQGNKMRDAYLIKKLADYDPQISRVYKMASGYIHLSEVAFHNHLSARENKNIEFTVGLPLREELNEILLQIAEAFIHYTLFEYQILRAVVESKERFDSTSSF